MIHLKRVQGLLTLGLGPAVPKTQRCSRVSPTHEMRLFEYRNSERLHIIDKGGRIVSLIGDGSTSDMSADESSPHCGTDSDQPATCASLSLSRNLSPRKTSSCQNMASFPYLDLVLVGSSLQIDGYPRKPRTIFTSRLTGVATLRKHVFFAYFCRANTRLPRLLGPLLVSAIEMLID